MAAMLDFLKSLQIESHVQPAIDIANIFLICVAGLAFYITFKEYRSNRRHDEQEAKLEAERDKRERQIGREASAKALYRDYLKVAMQYPRLSLAKYDKNDPIELDQYDTFLSIMLYSFDEVINHAEERHFVEVINYQVSVHDAYIRSILHKDLSESADFRGAYSPKLLMYIDAAFSDIDQTKKAANHNSHL